MKKILITGKNSYIGNEFEKWLMQFPSEYLIDKISLRDEVWKENDFSHYEVLLHVAGIAHVSADPKMKELYYKVNRDLTIEIAKKAKAEGVKQFIFMSSIIVYGICDDKNNVIDINTIPKPSNFYGNSKLLAEEGLKNLVSDEFKIVVIRPPMIYGKGSKGNYPRLANFARKTPIFPDFNNKRSMLHIDNLCEFLRLMIENEESGLYFPQNKEYVKTSELVNIIANIYGKKIFYTKMFNPLLNLLIKSSVISKVFGSLVYDKSMSEYKGKYQIREFKESVEMTESRD